MENILLAPEVGSSEQKLGMRQEDQQQTFSARWQLILFSIFAFEP
jgi:hypothetical protein